MPSYAFKIKGLKTWGGHMGALKGGSVVPWWSQNFSRHVWKLAIAVKTSSDYWPGPLDPNSLLRCVQRFPELISLRQIQPEFGRYFLTVPVFKVKILKPPPPQFTAGIISSATHWAYSQYSSMSCTFGIGTELQVTPSSLSQKRRSIISCLVIPGLARGSSCAT